MATLASIMAELESKGSAKTRKTYARHGNSAAHMFGVSVADLKTIAKTIKKRQELALELYATGNFDAMYLAGMVANGAPMSDAQLQSWVEATAGMQMISEYTVPWVAVESADGRGLALRWMQSKKEHIAAAGWCTYSGLLATRPDDELDLAEIDGLLATVVERIDQAQNRERYTMNNLVIAVGAYVRPLLAKAKSCADRIGSVAVDVGDTACRVSVASASIEKIEALGRVGQKRKTIRC